MQLANALVVYVASLYIRVFLLATPLLSLWNYYNTSRHAYTLLSELMLEVLMAAILLASLTLTKIDCARIANFLTLPLLLGAAYLNWAHQHRAHWLASLTLGAAETRSESSSVLASLETAPNGSSKPEAIDNDSSWASYSLADSIELALNNCLASLALVHLSANLFTRQLARVLN